jgi:hypothetical protein
MWRSFFLAIGITVFILGAECTVIDKALLKRAEGAQPAPPPAAAAPPTNTGMSTMQTQMPPQPTSIPVAQQRPSNEIVPPDWAPWTLMSGGAVIILYSFTIPRRLNG